MPLVVAAVSDCPRNSQMVTLNYWQTVWKKKKKVALRLTLVLFE